MCCLSPCCCLRRSIARTREQPIKPVQYAVRDRFDEATSLQRTTVVIEQRQLKQRHGGGHTDVTRTDATSADITLTDVTPARKHEQSYQQ